MEELREVRVITRGQVNARLADLNAFQEDIKILTEENYVKLKEAIESDGFAFSPHVFVDGEGKLWILDGHQRYTALSRMQAEGYHIPTIPCVEVEAESLEHARRLVMTAASQYGTFQLKKVVDFVKKTGLPPLAAAARFSLPTIKFERAIDVMPHQRYTASEEAYTQKIQAPVYQPKGECPKIEEMIDISKCKELMLEIERAELPADIEHFLQMAAGRHVVFDYEKIAEYYAHASPQIQDLMEKSALVIIDFKKAIENGFVIMTKELSEASTNEQE